MATVVILDRLMIEIDPALGLIEIGDALGLEIGMKRKLIGVGE